MEITLGISQSASCSSVGPISLPVLASTSITDRADCGGNSDVTRELMSSSSFNMYVQCCFSTRDVCRYTSERDVKIGNEGSSAPRTVSTGEFSEDASDKGYLAPVFDTASTSSNGNSVLCEHKLVEQTCQGIQRSGMLHDALFIQRYFVASNSATYFSTAFTKSLASFS